MPYKFINFMKLNEQLLKGNHVLKGILLSMFVFAGCAAQKGDVPMSKVCAVKWMHSHEEDEGDIKVFRPSTYKFPPTRGRRGFLLQMDGNALTSYDIAPTDGTMERKGNWKELGNNTIAFEYPKEPNRNYNFEIVSYKKKKLTIKIKN